MSAARCRYWEPNRAGAVHRSGHAAGGGPPGPYEAKLAGIPGVQPVVTADTLYAYIVDGTQIAVRQVDNGVDVTATVLCAGQ